MAFNLSSSNRSQLRRKLEGVYPTNFGVVQGGNGTDVNITGESLVYDVKTEMSKVLRADRLIASHTQVGATASGGITFEHQYKEFDWAYESILGNSFVAFGTGGVGAAVTTITVTANTLTADVATAGVNIWTALNKGQWFGITPAVGASQAVKDYLKGRAFKVSSTVAPTTTAITLDAATPINTAIVSAPLSGAKISSSRLFTGTSMSSYTLEMAHLDNGQFRIYTGMIPGKFSLKLAVGAIVTGTIDFMGKSMTLAQATSMGTPAAAGSFISANATRGVFDILEGGTSITANTYIKSADISVDGSLRMQDAVGVFGTAGIAPGTFKIGGTLEVYFADATMYQKFLDGTATSMSIPILDIAGNGYVYVFLNFTYTAAKVNAQGQDQDNTLSLTFECDYDTDAASATFGKAMAVYRVGV